MYLRKFFILGILFITCFISLFNANAQTSVPSSVGLVSWWSGDGNALDSRSRNNGTLQNGATYASGNVGQAFIFDGINDFVSVPKSAELNFGTGDFSVEFWVKWNSNASNSSGVISGDNYGAAGDYNGWLFNNDSGQVGWMTRRASVGTTVARVSSTNFSNGVWYHLAGVRSGRAVRLYVNGVLAATGTESVPIDVSNNYEIRIGSLSQGSPQNFNGQIDEPGIYARALSSTEIQSIYNAGTAGKSKPTATKPPANLVGFWTGDGNANDITGGNNGTLQNGAGFAVGKVGQSFNFDGIDDYIQTDLDVQPSAMPSVTFETWVFPQNPTGADQAIFSGDDGVWDRQIGISPDGTTFAAQTGTPTPFNSATVDYNQWQHIAVVYTPTNIKMYKNGVEYDYGSAPTGQNSSNKLAIGSNRCPTCVGGSATQQFVGKIDDASVYSRALTQTEITSIFNAGAAGKLKQNATPTGSNVAVNTNSDSTVTFPTVSTAGITEQIPLDLSTMPSLPNGSTTTGLTYDISTSAVFSGSPTVCFNLPSITNSSNFNNLQILHLETGAWQDRTDVSSINFASKTVCTVGLTSLSPFAIVIGAAPTASNASIAGRVKTADGHGIRNAVVHLSGGNLTEPLRYLTGAFGYYQFEDLPVGETYVLTINSKRYAFTPSTRVVTLTESLSEEDFTAAAGENSKPLKTPKVGKN